MKYSMLTRTGAIVFSLCLMTTVFAGCGKGKTDSDRTGTGKVGFLLADLTNEFFTYYGNSVKAALEAEGYSVTLASYNGETAKAVETIETFTTQGVELIMMMGATPDLEDALKAARGEGVKVLLADNEIAGAYDVTLVSDNKQIGGLIGSMGAKFWNEHDKDDPKAEALAIVYTYGGPDMANRSNAIVETFKAETGLSDGRFHIVEFTADSGDTTGQTLLENTLTKYPDTKVIVSFSDSISITAQNVMKANGRTGDEYGLFGTDATIQALLEIAGVNGPSIIRGTVSMGDIVSQTAENALKLLKNEFPQLPFRNEGPGVPVNASNVAMFLPQQ